MARLLYYSDGRRLAFGIDLFLELTTLWCCDLDEDTTLGSIYTSFQSATADIKARRRYVTTPSIAHSYGSWELVGNTVSISNRFCEAGMLPYGYDLNVPITRILGILDDLTNMVEWLITDPKDAVEYFDSNGGGFTESAVPRMTKYQPIESKDEGDAICIAEREPEAEAEREPEAEASGDPNATLNHDKKTCLGLPVYVCRDDTGGHKCGTSH